MNPVQAIALIQEGVKATRSVSPPLERGQLYLACDWEMLVDIGKQLAFPLKIADATWLGALVLVTQEGWGGGSL